MDDDFPGNQSLALVLTTGDMDDEAIGLHGFVNMTSYGDLEQFFYW